MEKDYYIYVTKEDVLDKGYDLSKALKVDHSGDINLTINHFLDEIAEIIYTKILDGCKDMPKAKFICQDEYYKNTIANMQLSQAVYVLDNGNVLAVADDTGMIDVSKLKSNANALSDYCNAVLNTLPLRYLGLA